MAGIDRLNLFRYIGWALYIKSSENQGKFLTMITNHPLSKGCFFLALIWL